jgi:hypothetical protein
MARSAKTILGFLILIFILLAVFIWQRNSPLSVFNFLRPAQSVEHEQENFTRSDKIPELPFPDNPDPDQCGIPVEWGNDNLAWLNGYYQGELIEPVVHLYDSHLRLEISAEAPHGSEVEILLYQNNPVLSFYLVRIKGAEGPGNQGWVPAPFLSFEPVDKINS